MRKVTQALPVLGCLVMIVGVVLWLKGGEGGAGPIGAGTGLIPEEGGTATPSEPMQGEPGFYLGLDHLRGEAEVAVHGRVRSVRTVSIEGTPFHEAMVTVERVLQPSDTTLSEVTLLVYGAELDGIATETVGTPELAMGEEVVLFLKKWSYGHVIVGIQQGLFKVVEEEGRKMAVRDYTWMSILGDSPSLQEGYERMPLATVLGESSAPEAPTPPVTPVAVAPTPAEPGAARPVTSMVLASAPAKAPTRGEGEGRGTTGWAVVLVVFGGVMVLASRLLPRGRADRAGVALTKLLVLFTVAVVIVVGMSSPGDAYVTQTRSSTSATELKWMFNDSTPSQIVVSSKSVKYAIHYAGTADISGDGEKTLIASQAPLWNTVNFHWLKGADDTRPTSSIKGNDNINTVYWLNASLVDPHGKDMTGIPGWTFTRFNTTTGELLDTDIFLNDKQIKWYGTGPIPFTTTDMDLGSVVTHEFGHASGLSHSPHQAATMIANAPIFDKFCARSLERDDILGILRKYPPSGYSGYTGRITGTIKDNASTPRNIHSGIVLARNATTGVVVAAVLSNKGSYTIEGLDPGTYVVQTQCAGRSMSDAPSNFAGYWGNAATLSWRSNASQDKTVTVSAGATTTANLTVTYGALSMKINELVTYLPTQLSWAGANAPIRVPKGAVLFPVGLKGLNFPAASSATFAFNTSDIQVVVGPHTEVGVTGALIVNISVPFWATAGPRNIELINSNGTRVIAVGAIEIY